MKSIIRELQDQNEVVLASKIKKVLATETPKEWKKEFPQIKSWGNDMTPEYLEEKFPWFLKAKVKDAELEYYYDGRGQQGHYLVWHNGTWINGTWKDGTWLNGTWKNGLWINGTWQEGTWKGGTWRDGIWLTGTWKDGVWKGGLWEDGIWEDGTWENGAWEGGTWKKGDWKGGKLWDKDIGKMIRSKTPPLFLRLR